MNKLIAYLGVAAGLGLCGWLASLRSVGVPAHEAAPAMVVAGGLFTVAIAALIRD